MTNPNFFRLHHEDGEHEHVHEHAHTHGDLTHTHPHTHTHSHDGGDEPHTHGADALPEHDHAHGCDNDCAACEAACDPMRETLALMRYMIDHNAAHARELAQLAKKLDELGNHTASEQVLNAVSEFEKGNLRLSAVLASLQ